MSVIASLIKAQQCSSPQQEEVIPFGNHPIAYLLLVHAMLRQGVEKPGSDRTANASLNQE